MRGRFLLFIVIFQVLLFRPVYAQDEKETGIIKYIEVIGLKRTKPHIARYPLEKFLGREGDSLDLNEVMAVVLDTMVLEPVTAELIEKEDGLILRVTVEEKWSIFPVPLFMINSGEINAGLFLADTNAFGIQDITALGGMYGSSGWLTMVLYQHTPARKGLPGWSTSFAYSRRNKEDTDRNQKIQRSYTMDYLIFFLGLNYPFANNFSASVSSSFNNYSLKKIDEAKNPPSQGAMILDFNSRVSFRTSNWDGYLLSGKSFSLGYKYNLNFSGPSFHSMEYRGVFEQPIVPGFRVNLRAGGIWITEANPDIDPLFEDSPMGAQIDILPWKFSARRYAGFSAGLEKYLFVTRWGTLSVLGSWQTVFSYGPISGFEFDHGPSGGIRFYLKKLALPALGGGAAYNMNSGRFQFAFFIGMDF